MTATTANSFGILWPSLAAKSRTVVILSLFVFQAQGGASQVEAPAAVRVSVKSFKITGNRALADSLLQAIVKPHVGKDLTLAELEAVADLITEEYRSHGYGIARAYIPQQESADGQVEILVLEGQLGTIEVRGNNFYSADFIKRHFTPVVEEKAIKQSSVERSLLLLNDHRDLGATAVLQAGNAPGSTDIIVKVEEKFPFHLSLDYNNFGSSDVSRHRFGVEMETNRYLPIEGSTLSIRGVMGSKTSDFVYGRTLYIQPVNNYGTKLEASVSGGDFDVGREFTQLGITGKSWGYSIGLRHPFVKTRFHSLTAEVGFESKDAKEFFLDTLSSIDKIRMLTGSIDYNSTDSTGRNIISFSINQGLGDTFGAMENNDPKSSRPPADNRFTRFTLIAARLQQLTEFLSVILRGSGQVTTRSLVASEQFSLGGSETVRGYPQGEFLGDHGYHLSTEVRVAPLPTRDLFQLAFFVDHGATAVRQAPVGTRSYQTLTGVGYGVRLNYSYKSLVFQGRLDVGFPVQPSKSSSKERPIFYVQTSLGF